LFILKAIQDLPVAIAPSTHILVPHRAELVLQT
jgi:hypothetical protein